MPIQLDLFKLHNPVEDFTPSTWVYVSGKNLNAVVTQMLTELVPKLFRSRYKLVKIIMKKLSCSHDTVYQTFNSKTKWLSLPIIIELYNVWLTKELEDKTKMKFDILNSVELAQSTSRIPKIIQIPRFLTKNLCRFAGAHAGDGSLELSVEIYSKNLVNVERAKFELENNKIKTSKVSFSKLFKVYRFSVKAVTKEKFLQVFSIIKKFTVNLGKSWIITFSETDKEFVKKYLEWVNKSFGLSLTLKETDETYQVRFSNKIIARYLAQIFEFDYGNKAFTVEIPEIIRSAPVVYQNAFVSGMMCESYVDLMGRITLLTRSKIGEDIGRIIKTNFSKDNLNISIIKNRSHLNGFEINSLDKDGYKYLLGFFPEGTDRWIKMKNLAFGFQSKVNTLSQAFSVLKYFNSDGIKLTDLLNLALNKNKFTIKEIKSLMPDGHSTETFRRYLNLLVEMSILNATKLKGRGSPNFYSFNENVKEWKLPTLS